MKNKNRILSLLLTLVMMFTCGVFSTSVKVSAAQVGETTKLYASIFAQNTDDWTWMTVGETTNLLYKTSTKVSSVNSTNALAKVNSTANFGLQIVDGNLVEGDTSTLKFHVGTVTIKADGYNDLLINLSKDYTQAYKAVKTGFGLAGNSTQIMLNAYLPTDLTARAAYLQKITSITADITVADYLYSKAITGQNLYTTPGVKTRIDAMVFAQNTSDWAWMSVGETASLSYQTATTVTGVNTTNALTKADKTANFGLNIVDANLAAKDSSALKFHVGTITVKATGYDDLVVNLNKDYSETYTAAKASWGLTGNNTQIFLNPYLPADDTARVNYLKQVTSVTTDITVQDYSFFKAIPPEPEFPADYTHPTTMRGLSAMDLVKDMKIGWNLGNSLESAGGETGWNNPVTTKKMIDEMKAAGFNTVRIPVRWDENYIDTNYTIDPAYMSRVETVINYALANDMYAIVNIHHNKIQGIFDEAHKDAVIKEGTAVWTQIANHFKDYSDKLIFDIMNEPRHGDDWGGTSEYYNVVNEYNAKIVPVIRATGENNATRLLLIPTYCASSDYPKVAALVVPKDTNIAVSIHAYMPYNFAMNIGTGSTAVFGDAEKNYIDKIFRLLNETFVKKGVPVVIGEFAATNKDNLQDRINFTKFYTATASAYGIPCCWWDNNNLGDSGTDAMGLLNRKTLTIMYPEIVQALLDGWNNPRDFSNYDSSVLFNGTVSCKNSGTAISFFTGLHFTTDEFVNNYAIAVDYTSTNIPQLILCGSNKETSWVTVAPSRILTKGTTKTAYFTVKDMVSTYKKVLPSYDTYGAVLPGLQNILVGDTGADLTVTKVYKTSIQSTVGDVDNNGVVDVRDLALIKKYILDSNSVVIDKINADMNNDGRVDIIDVALLKKKLLSA